MAGTRPLDAEKRPGIDGCPLQRPALPTWGPSSPTQAPARSVTSEHVPIIGTLTWTDHGLPRPRPSTSRSVSTDHRHSGSGAYVPHHRLENPYRPRLFKMHRRKQGYTADLPARTGEGSENSPPATFHSVTASHVATMLVDERSLV
jgi:hypothetical protein